MYNDLCAIQTARLSIDEKEGLLFEVSDPQEIRFSVAESIQASDYEGWPGPYDVVPKTSEQVLDVGGYVMRSDLTVHEIPYFEVSNVSGGMTASIG